MKRIFLLLFLTVTVRYASAQAWLPCGMGMQESIYGMAADSVHNRLFVGGVFSFIYLNQQYDTIQVHNMAIWDGHNWSKFIHDGGMEGTPNGTGTMLVWNNNLYYSYGTGFNGYIKKIDLDNMNTTALMGPLNGSIEDLVVYHDTLYACGSFSGMMSKWDGTNWISVTGGLGAGTGFGLYDMEVYNDKIYVVGNFEITSPYVTKDVAAYNNGVWEDVGNNLVADLGNLGTYVYAIKPYHNKFYIGGEFDTTDGAPGNALLFLEDSIWTSSPINNISGVSTLGLYNDMLYVSAHGELPGIPALPFGLFDLNDSTWEYTTSYYGLGLSGGTKCFETFQGDLYAAGNLATGDSIVGSIDGIAYLDLDTIICLPPIIAINNDTISVNGNGTIQWINCDNESIISGATSNTFIPAAFGNYAAIVNDGSCIDTSACVSYTGVNGELSIVNGVTLYPNPSSEKIKVEWNGVANEIELTDLLGRLILKQTVTPVERTKQLNLSNLNSGIYFLTIKTVTGSKTVKVVKE